MEHKLTLQMIHNAVVDYNKTAILRDEYVDKFDIFTDHHGMTTMHRTFMHVREQDYIVMIDNQTEGEFEIETLFDIPKSLLKTMFVLHELKRINAA